MLALPIVATICSYDAFRFSLLSVDNKIRLKITANKGNSGKLKSKLRVISYTLYQGYTI